MGSHIPLVKVQHIVRIICLEPADRHIKAAAQRGISGAEHHVGIDRRRRHEHSVARRHCAACHAGICLPPLHGGMHIGLGIKTNKLHLNARLSAIVCEIIQKP